MNKPIEVTDYILPPLETLKNAWGIYKVVAKFADGSEKSGSIQGDCHMWDLDTFEEE